MPVMTVLHFPDPRLREKALPVEIIDSSITSLARDMLETMYAEKGIGLAAIQVNVRLRVVVIDLSEEKNSPMILINPEILDREGTEEMQEGCLSVPGYYERVQRSEKIRYRYLDLAGNSFEQEADGLLAVCIQHEIDHLDGKLFVDYLSPLKQRMLMKKAQKQEKLQYEVL